MPSRSGYSGASGTTAIAAATGFVVLAVAVRNRWVQGWDDGVLGLVRPGDLWGPWQIRADVVVEGLRPVVAGALLALLTVVACGWRRSVRPALVSGAVGAVTVVLTVTSKLLVNRPDPHGAVLDHGGSFPSGHTVTVTVCLGLAIIIFRPPSRAAWVVIGAVGGLMAGALVVQGAHWATDVIGGGLLAVTVLATASAAGSGDLAAVGRRQTHRELPQ